MKTATLQASEGCPGSRGRIPRRPILRATIQDTPRGATSALVCAEITATPIRRREYAAEESPWSGRTDFRGEKITGWWVRIRSGRIRPHRATAAGVASSATRTDRPGGGGGAGEGPPPRPQGPGAGGERVSGGG